MIHPMNEYDIHQFINIAFQKTNYQLALQTIDIIKSLNNQFKMSVSDFSNSNSNYNSFNNTSTSTSTSSYSKPITKHRNIHRNNSHDDLFKKVCMTANRSPIKKEDQDIATIRSLLNKLSQNNYDSILDSLLGSINNIVNTDNGNIDILSSLIFDLASTNTFYSKLYSDLFTTLLEKYDFLKPTFIETLQNYKHSFAEFRNVDPNVDYNLYCEVNKENEKRKALSAFLVNLANNGLIPAEDIYELIVIFLNKIHSFINIPKSSDLVNEVVENIFILNNKELLDKLTDKSKLEYLSKEYTYFSACKSKDFVSLSSKAIFKFMDLNEII